MLNVTNSVVCAVLMFLMFPVAVAMSSTGHWWKRLGFAAVMFLLAVQVVAPMNADWLPPATLVQVLFNAILMLAALTARHELMFIVRLTAGKFSEPRSSRSDDLQMARASNKT